MTRFEFCSTIPNPLHGEVTAFDCSIISIGKTSERDKSRFFCRINDNAIPIQGIVEYDYSSVWYSVFCPGATHGASSLDLSKLGPFLRNKTSISILRYGRWCVNSDGVNDKPNWKHWHKRIWKCGKLFNIFYENPCQTDIYAFLSIGNNQEHLDMSF